MIRKIILLCLSILTVKTQLENCKEINEWKEAHTTQQSFNIDGFLEDDLPGGYIGKGSFGNVYLVNLITKSGDSMEAAMKVIEFTASDLVKLDMELMVNQHVSKTDLLGLPRYFGCALSIEKGRLFIFQELLSYPLTKYDIFDGLDDVNKFSVMLMMANAVKTLHSLGLAHLDIKPGNFVYLITDNPALRAVKLIDYGLCRFEDEPFFGGTLLYMGPELYKQQNADPSQDYKVDLRTDIYSLGLTFHTLYYGITWKNTVPTKILNYDSMIMYSNIRENKLKRDRATANQNASVHGKKKGYIPLFNKMLTTMVNPEINERYNIDNVINVLTTIIKKIDSEHMYLPEKEEELKQSLYGTLDETNTPDLTDNVIDDSLDTYKSIFEEKVNESFSVDLNMPQQVLDAQKANINTAVWGVNYQLIKAPNPKQTFVAQNQMFEQIEAMNTQMNLII